MLLLFGEILRYKSRAPKPSLSYVNDTAYALQQVVSKSLVQVFVCKSLSISLLRDLHGIYSKDMLTFNIYRNNILTFKIPMSLKHYCSQKRMF